MTVSSVKTGELSLSFALNNNFMEPIATTLVGSGGINNVTFNDIPQTYKHLQLRIMAKTTQTGDSDFVLARFNSDNSSTYNEHALYGTGSSASAMYNTGTGCIWQRIATDQHNASTFGVIVIDILDYTSTSKFKTIRNLGGFDDNGNGQIYFESNLWRSTDPITSIAMTSSVSSRLFKQHSRFSLYGIKG